MKMKLRRTACLVLALALALVGAGCGSAASEEAQSTAASTQPAASQQESTPAPGVAGYKVAMIFAGPINDNGWNTSAYNGLMSAETGLGIETAYSENVEMPDAEAAMTEYAIAGYDLIVAHGYQYTDAALNVAPGYPDVNFVVFNGTEVQEPNVASYDVRPQDTGFLAGAAAGILTESNIIGVMVADKSPKMQNIMESYVRGAEYVNPDVTVLTAYTDSTTDVSKGQEIANSMIEQGADIVSCNSNAVGVGSIGACKDAGIHAIGFISDQYDLAPEAVYISVISGVTDAIERLITDAYNGDFKPEIVKLGVPEGIVTYSSMHHYEQELAPELIERINQLYEDASNGKLDAVMYQ